MPDQAIADRRSDVISCRVRPLFTLLMLAALVVTQGTSLATSICRHASIQDHIAARQRLDPRKAAVAFDEETADAASAKKASGSSADSGPVLAALLPPPPAAAIYPGDRMRPRATDSPRLLGISLRPPLPPPLA